MDDEKPFDLRDKIALELLNGLISSGNIRSNDMIADLTEYMLYGNSKDKGDLTMREFAVKRFEHIIRSCYVAADIMRKVRLSSFE
jgi:hypothetical protein